jgi:two-component system, LytTR family, sensor kinase
MKHERLELKDTKVIRLIVDDQYRLLRHVMLSLGLLVIISFSNRLSVFYSNRPSEYPSVYKYYRLFSVYIALMTMFYINMYLLIPRFFFKGRYILYLVVLLILVMVCLALISNLLNSYFTPERLVPRERSYYEGTIILAPIILVTTMIKLFQRWTRDNQRIAELKNITLTMELNELRNQINPHFLFNMLNGIKALVRRDPEKATIVILKLSEFLRYQLYENNDEKILLRSEINFLTNFLDLEKLRRDNLSADISSQTAPRIINSVFLPPNLFTTFVENAVKHSVTISGVESYIRIKIEINEGKLYFHCVNSKDPDYKPSSEKHSGLGLVNIKRRLELLYADNYVLEVTSADSEHTIKLTVPI